MINIKNEEGNCYAGCLFTINTQLFLFELLRYVQYISNSVIWKTRHKVAIKGLQGDVLHEFETLEEFK